MVYAAFEVFLNFTLKYELTRESTINSTCVNCYNFNKSINSASRKWLKLSYSQDLSYFIILMEKNENKQ